MTIAPSKKFRLRQHFILISAISCCCAPRSFNAASEAQSGDGAKLEVQKDYVVSLPEISALTRMDTGSAAEVVAVGDVEHTAAILPLDRDERAGEAEKLSLASVFEARDGEPSQWEALAADGEGHLAVMQEYPGTIYVLNPARSRVSARIELKVPKSSPLHDEWEQDTNSRGEGMLLLSNGHIIVLKEKNPQMLVEFGPEGESASGWSPELFLSRGRPFPLPEQNEVTFVPLHAWKFKGATADLLADASDIAVGPDNRVYVLSDQARVIARFETELRPSEESAEHKAHWKLPKDVEKPEGLAIDSRGRPWVAIDQKDTDKPNLFVLEPIAR